MRNTIMIIIQLLCLWMINQIGYFVTNWLHLPVPGNVVGMIFLFLLLLTGVIPLKWVEHGSQLLMKHLAFFFIPIAVGLMAFGGFFIQHGIAILISLLISIAIGIYLTGLVSQFVVNRKEDVSREHIHYCPKHHYNN